MDRQIAVPWATPRDAALWRQLTDEAELIPIDLETLGLDMSAEGIRNLPLLSVAAVIRNEGVESIVRVSRASVAHAQEAVREMHTHNGLLEKALVSLNTAGVVDVSLAGVISARTAGKPLWLVARNAHFDWMRLVAELPRTAALFEGYLCVTGLRHALMLWFGSKIYNRKDSDHTALDDAAAARDELIFYANEYLLDRKSATAADPVAINAPLVSAVAHEGEKPLPSAHEAGVVFWIDCVEQSETDGFVCIVTDRQFRVKEFFTVDIDSDAPLDFLGALRSKIEAYAPARAQEGRAWVPVWGAWDIGRVFYRLRTLQAAAGYDINAMKKSDWILPFWGINIRTAVKVAHFYSGYTPPPSPLDFYAARKLAAYDLLSFHIRVLRDVAAKTWRVKPVVV